jgi:molybdate transport system regulatory protein
LKSLRYKGLTLRVLGKSGAAMGPGKAELIERIAETGSISAAARDMEMSYRRAWQLVEALNADFREPIVTTSTGGARGGGAHITDFGLKVVRRYREMEGRASSAIADELKSYAKLLK